MFGQQISQRLVYKAPSISRCYTPHVHTYVPSHPFSQGDGLLSFCTCFLNESINISIKKRIPLFFHVLTGSCALHRSPSDVRSPGGVCARLLSAHIFTTCCRLVISLRCFCRRRLRIARAEGAISPASSQMVVLVLFIHPNVRPVTVESSDWFVGSPPPPFFYVYRMGENGVSREGLGGCPKTRLGTYSASSPAGAFLHFAVPYAVPYVGPGIRPVHGDSYVLSPPATARSN